MSSFCYCSRQHRELFLLILKSHLCLHLLLESSQTAIKESNSHKILCMQEASLETEDSVTFISDKQHNLYRLQLVLSVLSHYKEIAAKQTVSFHSNWRCPLFQKFPRVLHLHFWDIMVSLWFVCCWDKPVPERIWMFNLLTASLQKETLI